MADARRFSGRLLLWTNLLGANAAAVIAVVGYVDPAALGLVGPAPGNAWSLPLETVAARSLFAAAVGLLILNLVWLLRRQPAAPPLQHVLSESPGGSVRIAREAIETGLRAAGEALPEITRLRVNVDPGNGRRIAVHSQFQCAEGVSNLAASQRLRQVLQDRFHAIVQLSEGARADFELEFLGFQGRLPKKASESAANLEPEPQPFLGPQYPIDDDDAHGSRL
jgi:hypothetical protein